MDVETAVETKLTKFKFKLLAYKRSAVGRQTNLPVAVAAVPQPATTVGQGDQLAEHLKHEAKGKMPALVNKLKNNFDGIRQDARADEQGTSWEDAVNDDIKKAMKDKDRWITCTIQLEDDFSS